MPFIVWGLVQVVCVIVPALVGVAFLTLLERKGLSYSQLRKGPNKVSIGGILVPFADAIKLLTKSQTIPTTRQPLGFKASPVMSLSLALLLWSLVPLPANSISWELSVIAVFVVMAMNVYPLVLAGWASNSKYPIIGGVRGVAQTISYEVSMALVLLGVICLFPAPSLLKLSSSLSEGPLFLLSGPLVLLWLVCSVIETNRAPFDFSEGESELVSGFNTEYGAGGFTLLFLAEYATIIMFSVLGATLAGAGPQGASSSLSLLILYGWVWVRASLPRYRYDLLMGTAWKVLLPLSMLFLVALGGMS